MHMNTHILQLVVEYKPESLLAITIAEAPIDLVYVQETISYMETTTEERRCLSE